MKNSLNKFNNKITTIDSIKFHSKKEADRYKQLKLLEKSGLIKDLVLQKRWPININEVKICTYISDFDYYTKYGEYVCEDVKGFKKGPAWNMYRLKSKLMKAIYNINISEI